MVDIQKDDVQKIVNLLPEYLQEEILKHDLSKLIEIVLDLGRIPEARFAKRKTIVLGEKQVTKEMIAGVVDNVGEFNIDNRAGLEGTLHRISCIKNRKDEVVGLTLRIGRSVFGTIKIIQDTLDAEKSALLLGPPGVGKTTMLREIAYYLSTVQEKRVVIIDTSNEIAGDGDTPHPAIGRARRMQVPRDVGQHNVMIEAVENHTPEVIIIDEIGTKEEAYAARTIAERGVKLIATAHGTSLENIIKNPTLSDLIGGIQTVTLGDEEAKKRGSKKTVLERAASPSFDACVEIVNRFTVNVHGNVATSVDAILRGLVVHPELRQRDKETDVVTVLERSKEPNSPSEEYPGVPFTKNQKSIAIYPYAVSKGLIKRAFSSSDLEFSIASTLDESDIIFALKSYADPAAKIYEIAENKNIPIKIINDNSVESIDKAINELIHEELPSMNYEWDKLAGKNINPSPNKEEIENALSETLSAINQCLGDGRESTEFVLSPQIPNVRKKQHELIQQYNLSSKSVGAEPARRVVISR